LIACVITCIDIYNEKNWDKKDMGKEIKEEL